MVASRYTEGHSEAEKLENARKRVRPTGIRQFILEVRFMEAELCRADFFRNVMWTFPSAGFVVLNAP